MRSTPSSLFIPHILALALALAFTSGSGWAISEESLVALLGSDNVGSVAQQNDGGCRRRPVGTQTSPSERRCSKLNHKVFSACLPRTAPPKLALFCFECGHRHCAGHLSHLQTHFHPILLPTPNETNGCVYLRRSIYKKAICSLSPNPPPESRNNLTTIGPASIFRLLARQSFSRVTLR